MEAIRKGYEDLGVDNFYIVHSCDYSNPHEGTIKKLLYTAKKDWDLGDDLLDLCCGSGEVTRVFIDKNIEGIDPYTSNLYIKTTGKDCKSLSFKDIVEDGLDKKYDTIICSFAMHLCEESMLPMLLYRLGEVSDKLLIITPHKRPNCNGIYGWKIDKSLKEEKVNMVLYKRN